MTSSYIPLYRKYRPQSFADLAGQEALVSTLSNAIELNKVAHAYLFTGPRGTGKTSAARIFAKSLNCKQGPTVAPCGKCPSCEDMANGTSLDIIEIDAASNNRVEDARNLLEKVQFVPVSGKYKIYIIDEVHMLTTQAFNTLLKTLEEPPANLIFILATTEPHKVLETIISRCQRFDFRRIKPDTISKRLKYITEKEGLNIEDNALSLIARKSSGGLRDAVALLDQASVLGLVNGCIAETDILNLLGCISEDVLFEIADNIAKRDSTNLINSISSLTQAGSEPMQVLRDLINYFRNLMLVKTTSNAAEISSILDVSEQFQPKLKAQSEHFEVIEVAQIIEKLSEHERLLRNTTNQHLWLEVALIGITHRHDIQVVRDLEARIIKLEQMLSSGNIPVAKENFVQKVEPPKTEIPKPNVEAPKVNIPMDMPKVETVQKDEPKQETSVSTIQKPVESEVSQNTAASNVSDISSCWKNLLENVYSDKPLFSLLRDQAQLLEFSVEGVTLTFKNALFMKMAQNKVQLIEKAAEKVLGVTPKLTIRTFQPGDEKKNNETPVIKEVVSKAPVEKVKQDNQISSEVLLDNTVLSKSENTPAVNVYDESEDELPELSETNVRSLNLSDQARMVLDLFQGKIIE